VNAKSASASASAGAFARHLTAKFDTRRRVVGLLLGWPRLVPRSTAVRHPGGAARLISLRHPWRRSNRRPLAGRPCPASLPTTLTAPSGVPCCGGPGGRPSVVAGWRDRDVRVSRRRSARSQGRRRAVKQGCPSVARAQHSGALPVALPRPRRADVASTTPPAPRPGRCSTIAGRRRRVYLESASDSVAPEHLRGARG
jgi:hypothetical protein